MRRFLEALGSGVAVYGLVAACSAAGASGTGERASVGTGAGASFRPYGGSGGAAEASASPVPDARAESPGGPLAVEALCDKSDGDQGYAEALFPGRTADDLAFVASVATLATGSASAPHGYSKSVNPPLVGDGRVALSCGPVAAPWFSSVRFILPAGQR